MKGGIGHWLLIVIYMLSKEVHFYDSCGGEGREYVEHILHWIKDEIEKDCIQFDKTQSLWSFFAPIVPLQKGGKDCGLFVIVLADYLSDNLPLSYTYEMMPNFRLKIGTDIIRGSLLY